MAKMTKTIDSFTQNQTRLVVIIDGLDSCEQDKVLQMLDTVRNSGLEHLSASRGLCRITFPKRQHYWHCFPKLSRRFMEFVQQYMTFKCICAQGA